MLETLEDKLAHSKAAYNYAINNLPKISSETKYPIQSAGFLFENESQIKSMLIEFGWSFFCRYEGCLEAYLKKNNIKLSKKKSLKDWLIDQNVNIPNEFLEGLEVYRKIRNKLHHEDGTTFEKTEDMEIHLFPIHMQNFYDLFVWCGKQIDKQS